VSESVSVRLSNVIRQKSYRIRWHYAAVRASYGYYAVQVHPRSPSMIPIKTSYATSY